MRTVNLSWIGQTEGAVPRGLEKINAKVITNKKTFGASDSSKLLARTSGSSATLSTDTTWACWIALGLNGHWSADRPLRIWLQQGQPLLTGGCLLFTSLLLKPGLRLKAWDWITPQTDLVVSLLVSYFLLWRVALSLGTAPSYRRHGPCRAVKLMDTCVFWHAPVLFSLTS